MRRTFSGSTTSVVSFLIVALLLAQPSLAFNKTGHRITGFVHVGFDDWRIPTKDEIVGAAGNGANPAAGQVPDVEPAGVPTKSALQTDQEGWVDIMPRGDLEGWSRVPVPPKGMLGRAQWHVDTDRKVLICDGDGGHDMLLLKKALGDAIFHFEFRYTRIEGRKGYNSGAYVRNSPDGAIWHQAQFGDAQDGFLFGVTPTTEGKPSFFTLKKVVRDGRVKPAGEWNTMEVTAQGKTLTLWVNGAVTCRFNNCGKPTGHVGLEGEGYRVEFRNLKVKKLPLVSEDSTEP